MHTRRLVPFVLSLLLATPAAVAGQMPVSAIPAPLAALAPAPPPATDLIKSYFRNWQPECEHCPTSSIHAVCVARCSG